MANDALTVHGRLLTTGQAAHILNVHENTLRRWCDHGIVKCYRIGSAALRRIPEDDIIAISEYMHTNHGQVRGFQCCLLMAGLLRFLAS